MKIQTLSLLAASVVALGTVTGAVAKSTPAATPAAVDTADGAFAGRGQFGETSGEAMYRRVCAACHMPDAKGAQGAGFYPALAGNPKLEAGGYPLSVLMQGMNGMPALGMMMSDQQAADVVNYVRTHFGNRYKDPVTPAEAKDARAGALPPGNQTPG
jgi:mono/diheme cytochrome c family protein